LLELCASVREELEVTTYFCDGLKEVSVVNGVVRLEFHRLEAVQRGGNRELQPTAEFTIALPLQGFMQALGVLENVRARFAEQGLLTPTNFSRRRHPAARTAGEVAKFYLMSKVE
jgi:hypothetical protein